MATRRVIKSALSAFLGTYTSRNSDLQGYWLFGQVEPTLRLFSIDLLASPPDDCNPQAAAHRIAVPRYTEQLAISGLTPEVVREARLEAVPHPDPVSGLVGDYPADGHLVDFTLIAVMDDGRTYRKDTTVFVAPHDPRRERRRGTENWGA